MSALKIAHRKRYEAARARRMAFHLANGDKRALCAYAEELEADADRIERAAAPPQSRSLPANSRWDKS